MKIEFFKRDLSDKMTWMKGRDTNVLSWSISRLGGYRRGKIAMRDLAIDEVTKLLRGGVRIRDDDLNVVWEGFISGVRYSGAVVLEKSLNSMFNRITVAYRTQIGEGTIRENSSLAEDDDSQDEYGIKALVTPIAKIAESGEADRIANQMIGQYGAPKFRYIQSAPVTGASELHLCGLAELLRWEYFNPINIEYRPDFVQTREESNNLIAIGDTVRTSVAQQFTVGTGEAQDVFSVSFTIVVRGDPTDAIRVRLYSDNEGAVGSELATFETALDVESGGQRLEMTSPYSLTEDTSYWLVFDRTGSADQDNFYEIDVDDRENPTDYPTMVNQDGWESADHTVIFSITGSLPLDSFLDTVLSQSTHGIERSSELGDSIDDDIIIPYETDRTLYEVIDDALSSIYDDAFIHWFIGLDKKVVIRKCTKPTTLKTANIVVDYHGKFTNRVGMHISPKIGWVAVEAIFDAGRFDESLHLTDEVRWRNGKYNVNFLSLDNPSSLLEML